MYLQAGRGRKVFTGSCCDCASLALNFIRIFKCICQTLPNSHTGLAIRTVWRKWCGLGIRSGLCCYSRNDARAWVRLQNHPVPSGWFWQHFSLSWIPTCRRTVSLGEGNFHERMLVGVPKHQVWAAWLPSELVWNTKWTEAWAEFPPTHPKGDAEHVNWLCVKSIMCYCDGLFWIKIQISDILE